MPVLSRRMTPRQNAAAAHYQAKRITNLFVILGFPVCVKNQHIAARWLSAQVCWWQVC
jgi:hypothetical protein